MANGITAMSASYLSRRIGQKLYKNTIFRSLASFVEMDQLKDGQSVDRPYRADIVVENYTKGTALTAQDLTATADVLTVNVVKGALIYVDDVDKIQNRWSAANEWGDEMGKRLAIAIDSVFLYEVVNANDTIDSGDVGGTAGQGITVTTSNIDKVFSAINKKFDVNNVDLSARNLVISPQFKEILVQRVGGKETMLGDRTSLTGNVGRYLGLELYLSNNLTGSAVWEPADNPSNGATVTIASSGGTAVTFTFVSSIGSTAGNILQTTDTSTTLIQLKSFINGGGLETATGCTAATCQSLSTANQRIVQEWVAVTDDDTTATTITVRVKGGSYLTLTSSESTDVWTTSTQIQHLLATKSKAIDVAIQKEPGVKKGDTISAGKSGVNILGLTLFGTKTFDQGTKEIFDVQIRADNY